MEFLDLIAASAPAQALKGSFWAYPLVNAGHILGIALLIGAICVLDLRLLGVFPNLPTPVLAAATVPVAATGLTLAVLTGLLLFTVKPAAYAGSDLFLGKMALLALGLINVALVRRTAHWRAIAGGTPPAEPPALLKAAALASLGLWIGTLLLGRLIGYFM